MLDREDLLLLFSKKTGNRFEFARSDERNAAHDELIRTGVSRSVNKEIAENLSLLKRIADRIAWFGGSMRFLMLNPVWFVF